MTDIVILGGGLTGLSAAFHLEQCGFFDYTLYEKDATVGGLCRSLIVDGFTFDYTGHLLHISDQYFHQFIHEHVGFEHFETIMRRSFIYSHDRYTRYPYQMNLNGLPTETVVECIAGYVNRQRTKNPKRFTDWVESSFGCGFAKNFFIPYQEKIFDYAAHKLTASWTGRFVPQTSLEALLRGALEDQFDNEIGYNARFFYPQRGGIAFWINAFARKIKTPIFCGKKAIRINLAQRRIDFSDGSSTHYKRLISTLPLDHLIGMLQEPAHSTLYRAQNKLLCNSVINFNLGVARPDLSEKHWIYFPEKQFPFYRIGFPHNFTPTAAPPGHSSLYGEFSALNRPSEHIEKQLSEARRAVCALFKIDTRDIAVEKIITIDRAYVIYNAWRDKNLSAVLKELVGHGIHSVGRYGAWKYSSMQEGLLDGKYIADMLTILPTYATSKSASISERTHSQVSP
jgi:protoporphyrinogen oxidase